MGAHTQLRQFKSDELLFDEEEARIILKFIFKTADHELIDSLSMNDRLKGFAQGLLVEAIDASYGVGFVEAVFRSTVNPTKGAIKVLKGFGKKASKHWFKHATVNDLQDVKVYEFVVDYLAVHFRKKLVQFQFSSKGQDKNEFVAFLDYKKPFSGRLKVWG